MSDIPKGYEGLAAWAKSAPIVTVENETTGTKFTGRLVGLSSDYEPTDGNGSITVDITGENMIVELGASTWRIIDFKFPN